MTDRCHDWFACRSITYLVASRSIGNGTNVGQCHILDGCMNQYRRNPDERFPLVGLGTEASRWKTGAFEWETCRWVARYFYWFKRMRWPFVGSQTEPPGAVCKPPLNPLSFVSRRVALGNERGGTAYPLLALFFKQILITSQQPSESPDVSSCQYTK